MVLAIDVYYKERMAKAVGVLFDWEQEVLKEVIVEYIDDIEDYTAGEFYKRELPCILKIIEQINLVNLEAIIIDGYVFIDNEWRFGLGGKLWEALSGKIAVIGVAKTSYLKNKDTVEGVKRGVSNNPLHISAIGLPLSLAANRIKQMKGDYRIPDILKFLDRKTRED